VRVKEFFAWTFEHCFDAFYPEFIGAILVFADIAGAGAAELLGQDKPEVAPTERDIARIAVYKGGRQSSVGALGNRRRREMPTASSLRRRHKMCGVRRCGVT